ncbi:unnamed protein product, partial [Didymodactylos carnosus]
MFHQYCTSDFASANWINYSDHHGNKGFSYDDYRWTGPLFFQALLGLCQLTNETIQNDLVVFRSSKYVTSVVQPEILFYSQTQSLIDVFISTTTDTFFQVFNMARYITDSNQIVSGVGSNFYAIAPSALSSTHPVQFFPSYYSDCSCSIRSWCNETTRVYDSDTDDILYVMPGLITGCTIVYSALYSNLKCFYNQSCIDESKTFMGSIYSLDVTALNSSAQSQYDPNSTVDAILAQLFVEKWNSGASFSSYYEQCRPLQCTFTYSGRNNIVYIVTTIIGLFGGLTKVLLVIIPSALKLVRRGKRPAEESE